MPQKGKLTRRKVVPGKGGKAVPDKSLKEELAADGFALLSDADLGDLDVLRGQSDQLDAVIDAVNEQWHSGARVGEWFLRHHPHPDHPGDISYGRVGLELLFRFGLTDEQLARIEAAEG